MKNQRIKITNYTKMIAQVGDTVVVNSKATGRNDYLATVVKGPHEMELGNGPEMVITAYCPKTTMLTILQATKPAKVTERPKTQEAIDARVTVCRDLYIDHLRQYPLQRARIEAGTFDAGF